MNKDPIDDLMDGKVIPGPGARPPKIRYTHTDMIDFLIANPWVTQNEVAARYGYSVAWVSTIITSDAFQSAMAARREEIVDPTFKATIEERFKALTVLSLEKLMKKLEAPQVSDQVALRAAELGAKALGIGGNAAPPPSTPAADHLAQLANRLIDLQSNIRRSVTIEAEITSKTVQ